MADEPRGIVEETNEEIEAINLLEPEEREMYDRQNTIIDNEEDEEEIEEESEESEDDGVQEETEETQKDVLSKDVDKEKVSEVVDVDNLTDEQEHEALSGFNKNEKALYFKQKNEKRKRQEAQADRDYYKMQTQAREKELLELRTKLAKQSVDRDLDLDDEEESDLPEEEKPLTKKDLLEIEEAKARNQKLFQSAQDRVDFQEREALQTTFDGDEELYNKVKQLGQEIIAKEVEQYGDDGVFSLKLLSEAKREDGNVVDVVLKCARTHDDYYKIVNEHKKSKSETKPAEGSEDIEKIKKNTKKRTSSAALGGSGTKKTITSYDDMSYSEFANLPHSEYIKVPKPIRDKFLSM